MFKKGDKIIVKNAEYRRFNGSMGIIHSVDYDGVWINFYQGHYMLLESIGPYFFYEKSIRHASSCIWEA